MAVSDWSTTAANNTLLGALNVNTGMPIENTDNAIRELMAQLKAKFDSVDASMPTGAIIIWSGSVGSIPTGWALCNGSNGTPDLRNRFVVGAGSTYAVAATGGSANAVNVSHTHTASVTDPGHTHNLPGSTSSGGTLQTQIGVNSTAINATAASNTTGISVAISTEGSSGTNANLPPYYALCYIMKV